MSSASPTASEATATSASSPIMSHRQILFVIYALMAGMFLSALDQTVVGTAIRTIGDDLHGLDQQAWVTTAYLITSTISTPIYGKLSDIFGRRPLFIFGISVFLVGSLLASFSDSMLMLAAFRAVQGLGAGALMSLPLAIMGDILAPRERAKYQGYFFAVFGLSSVIGPLVGGLFSGANEILWIAGWRWVFLINVPIGILALVMVISFLHLPKFHEHGKRRIDWWGATAVIVGLVPLLLVAEKGRDWGWTSPIAIGCYVTGGIGVIAFIVIESLMKDDAIIPMKLFRSQSFSMATVIGVLVGFGMFGAMLTIPLYLQIVTGLNPTESGFAMLPMILGLMIAAIGSGQILSRTGKYRIFPITGTLVGSIGFLLLTQLRYDTPFPYLMLCMFCIGLGLGQLMQTLTIASQNSVEPRDMGVATSASTFFRQMGGTLGTAILLSVLFSSLPHNVVTATGDKQTLTSALSAALDPSVAEKPNNKGAMRELWTPITSKLESGIQTQLDEGTKAALQAADDAVNKAVTEGVDAKIAAGALPAVARDQAIAKGVEAAKPDAEAKALQAVADKAHGTVDGGKVVVDWKNESQRTYWIDQLVPKLSDEIKKGDSGSDASNTSSDTSFLTGADIALTKPFLVGFSQSVTVIYWIAFADFVLAFILSLFFKVPPMRTRSAMQQRADEEGAVGVSQTGTVQTVPVR